MSCSEFSNKDFLNLFLIYGECQKILGIICNVFEERYPTRQSPLKDFIRLLLHNCNSYGQFRPKRNSNASLTSNGSMTFFSAYRKHSCEMPKPSSRILLSSLHRILKVQCNDGSSFPFNECNISVTRNMRKDYVFANF